MRGGRGVDASLPASLGVRISSIRGISEPGNALLGPTNGEIGEALELCARREVWPLVTETYALDEANRVHDRLEAEAITGRAAIVI